eukprot:2828650-Prymnesium_polylepis.2
MVEPVAPTTCTEGRRHGGAWARRGARGTKRKWWRRGVQERWRAPSHERACRARACRSRGAAWRAAHREDEAEIGNEEGDRASERDEAGGDDDVEERRRDLLAHRDGVEDVGDARARRVRLRSRRGCVRNGF